MNRTAGTHASGWGRMLHDNGRDLAPIVLVIVFFQLLILREPITGLTEKLIGLSFVLIGLSLFLGGLSMSLFPLGEQLATEFVRRGNRGLLLLFAFAIGFGSTVAEPALILVVEEAATAMAPGGDRADLMRIALALRWTTAVAVGLSLMLSCLRILRGWPAWAPVATVYAMALLVIVLQPPASASIAFDAGAAATSAINVPLIAALGIGLATAVPGRTPLADGFGAIALASAMPMIVLLLGSLVLS